MSTATPSSGLTSHLDDWADIHRFSVDDYHKMLSIGVMFSGEPVELISGYVVKKRDDRNPPAERNGHPKWALLRQFTVDEYHALIDAGILTPDDRVELLDGYVVNKMAHNTPHGSTVERLSETLYGVKPAGWRVRIQLPVSLAEGEPEPDGALIRGDRDTYSVRHPTGSDFGTVIEVADSSLLNDRVLKLRMYARAGIPIYWIINLIDSRVEVYTIPDADAAPPAYMSRTDYQPGQSVPLVLDGVTIASIPVADLLP